MKYICLVDLLSRFIRAKKTLKLLAIPLAILMLPLSAAAVTNWNYCTTGPQQSCEFPVKQLNSVQVRLEEATVRYGVSGQYSYRTVQTFVFPGLDQQTKHEILCGPETFGDPFPNRWKKCSYTYDSLSGDYSPHVLHTIKDSEYDPDDLNHVRARSQFNNLIYSENRQYHLRLNQQGEWSLWRGWTKLAAMTPVDPEAYHRHSYRVSATQTGLALYRNNTVIWRLSAGNGHFALMLSDDGVPMLIETKSKTIRMSFVRNSNGTYSWRESNSPLPDDTFQQLLSLSGFDHHEDWSSFEHDKFDELHKNSNQSLWHWHSAFDKLEKKVKGFANTVGNQVHKDFDTLEHFLINKIQHSAIEHWVENAASKIKFVESIEKIVEEAFVGDGLTKAFAAEIEAALREQGEYDQTSLLNQVNEAQANAQIFTSRKLDVSQPVSGTVHCKGICKFLSSNANKSMRIDYALEAAPTFLGKAFFGSAALGTGRALNQLQVRAFFTHPRIRDDRYYTEIRLRFLDFSGGGVFTPESNTFASADLVAGTISIHDLILPYSWGKHESFLHNARFEGAKWLAGTGLAVEADGEFPGVSVNLSQVVGNTANVVRKVSSMSAAGGAMMGFAHINEAISTYITADGRLMDVDRLSRIAEHVVVRQPSIEAGAGMFGATLYDVEDISELVYGGLSSSRAKHALTVGTIALVETFGGLAGIALGTLTGINEVASFDAAALVTAVNSELMAGSWLADLSMWGLFRASYGYNNPYIRTYGIGTTWLTYRHNFEIVNWEPFRNNISRFYPDTAPQLKSPVRFRAQWNWDFYTRQW